MPLAIHRLDPRLRKGGWARLLRTWATTMDAWCRVNRASGEHDLPYWYGERPLTGLLASAAWTLRGGHALEEFATVRGPIRRAGAGRIDAYIVLNKVWYQIEAKMAWPTDTSAKGTQRAISRVSHALSQAADQLDDVDKTYYGNWGLAVCYVVPGIVWPKRSPKPPAVSLLRDLARRYTQRRMGIVACYTPPPWANLVDAGTKREARRSYPGVLLLARVRWKPRRPTLRT
jgi:hypothetical protein